TSANISQRLMVLFLEFVARLQKKSIQPFTTGKSRRADPGFGARDTALAKKEANLALLLFGRVVHGVLDDQCPRTRAIVLRQGLVGLLCRGQHRLEQGRCGYRCFNRARTRQLLHYTGR
ncbi:MAG: hypothetical protein ABI771_11220, partial [Betaproteobacteria bacterium]